MSAMSDLDITWNAALTAATRAVADDQGDELVVLPKWATGTVQVALHDAAQHDDGVSAVAAIDVLRILVEQYSAAEAAYVAEHAPPAVVPTCGDHPDAATLIVESGYARTWYADVNPDDGKIYATERGVDWESGAGDDQYQCATCLIDLGDVIADTVIYDG